MKSSELIGKKVALGQVTFTSINAWHMLKRDGVDVMTFFDKDYRLQHKQYKGTPIFPWANFHDLYIILTIPHRYEELKEMLVRTCGYSPDRILRLEDISFSCTEADVRDEYDWNWLAENTTNVADAYISSRQHMFRQKNSSDGMLITPYMAIDVNNRCTLNCEYCYTQMPYYQAEEKRDYDMDCIIDCFDSFLDKVDYIPYLWILGGEPLLHPRLHELIAFLNGKKAQEKVAHTDILTNGTLLFSDEAIRNIRQNPFFWRISISPYGIHSTRQLELFSQLNIAGIPYYSRYMVYWQKFGRVKEPETLEEESIRKKCEHCCCLNIHLTEGKLYRCPVLAHFVLLHKIPHNEKNAFDCSKPYTRAQLYDYLEHYAPGMAYCNANHQVYIQQKEEMDAWGGEMIPVASQAKGILPYKRYE